MVEVFGKDGCPYTQAAIEDYRRRGRSVQYINVKANPADMDRMLAYSGGKRRVPVIVDDGRVTIGFGGT
jgi:glutaredoxin 3